MTIECTLHYKVRMTPPHVHSSKAWRLPIVMIAEWLMVLPAAILLGAAALRSLGGRGLPVQIAQSICNWAFVHLSHPSAALLFIAMPGIVLVAGSSVIWRTWRTNQALRDDLNAALAMLRRHPVMEMLATATLLAGAVLLFVVVHLITD